VTTITLTFDNLGEATALERGTWDGTMPLGRDPSVTVALPRLLDELERHGLRATFCVEAINCELYPAALHKIADRGHELAGHGWRHEPWSGLEPDHESELLRRCRTVFAAHDLEVSGFRPPGGELAGGDPELLSAHGFAWCSPFVGDGSAPEPVAGSSLRYVPFTWDLVDAYLLMDSFAAVRERRGDPGPPFDAAGAGRRLRKRLLGQASTHTLVMHPFLMLDDAWWAQTRGLPATIAEQVTRGAMRCLTAGNSAAAARDAGRPATG
jgi:peptidoglycan/xylan/chitin deacetylase (PgdA/CDA1 family)